MIKCHGLQLSECLEVSDIGLFKIPTHRYLFFIDVHANVRVCIHLLKVKLLSVYNSI